MICIPCREKLHEACENTSRYIGVGFVKRPEPIKACACQHKKSWPLVTTSKDNDGDSKES